MSVEDTQLTELRLRPDPAEMRRENLTASLITTMIVPLILAFGRDESNLLTLTLFGLLGGFVTYFFYALRGRSNPTSIILNDEGIEVAGPKKSWTLPWSEVESVGHTLYGGESWSFRTKSRKSYVLRVEGLTSEEGEELKRRIRANTGS